jgi:transcription termination factor Rho
VRSARSECLDHLIVFSEANLRLVRRCREALFFDDRSEALIILDSVPRYSPARRKIVSLSAYILTGRIASYAFYRAACETTQRRSIRKQLTLG